MLQADQLLALVVASAVVVAVPGPSVLFVIGRALAHGRRPALLGVLGHVTGAAVVAAVVAAGLGSVLQRSATLLLVVKLLGAAYLVWLGVSALRSHAGHTGGPAGDATDDPAPPRGTAAPDTARLMAQGFWVGLLNPKILLFFAAFVPQFVQPDAGPVPLQMLVLSLVTVSIGALCDAVWALTASTARTWFATEPRRLTWFSRAGGLLTAGLGGGIVGDEVLARRAR